jgi:Phage Mu protein F like protein
MSTSRLQQTVQHYRAQLLQHEMQAERVLNEAHLHTLASIQPALDKLYKQIADAQQGGGKISPSWLYEQRRLETLNQLITHQVDQYGALASHQAGQLQHMGMELGLQAGQQQLKATVPPGVSWSFGTPSTSAIADLVGSTQAGSPLATLFSGFGQEAADGAAKALITGLSLGNNPRQVAALVQQALGISRNRALTISRSTMLDAYRSSNLATYQANSDVVDKWRWDCDKSPRTCIACLAMDGTLHDLSEEMDTHVNDRCTPTPVTKSWSDLLSPLGIDTSDLPDDSSGDDTQTGADWLDNQDEAVQKQILGNAGYDLWKNNDISLMDFVGKSSDPTWGNSIYRRSIKDIMARK